MDGRMVYRIDEENDEGRQPGGYEALKEALIAEGCNKAQVESKVVRVCLKILSGNPDIMKVPEAKEDLALINKRIKEMQETIVEKRRKIEELKEEYKSLEESFIERTYSLRMNEIHEAKEYMKKFVEMMESAESAEDRDLMRKAQMFVNTVNVNTVYDNTAFIIGLASILSNGKAYAMDELKQINPKLFEEKAKEAKDEVEESKRQKNAFYLRKHRKSNICY